MRPAVLALVICTAVAAPVARAAAEPGAIVLESHVGQRSADAAALVAPVLDELERRGFAARPANVARQIGDAAPRPGILDAHLSTADITRIVKAGTEAFATAEFGLARAKLSRAAELIERNPGLCAADPTLLQQRFKALIVLAQAYVRLGQADDVAATMTELLRAFPGQVIPRARYGPEPEQLYREAIARSHATPLGRLAITVDDDRARIFVDGVTRGAGKVVFVDVLPGRYHVFVQVLGSEGRQYTAEVPPGGSAALDIAWKLDATLTISDAWVGLSFASEAERAREAEDARALAARWNSEAIVLVDPTRLDDKPAVRATLVRGGSIVRKAVVVPGASHDATLRALARFVADGTPSPELRLVLPDGPSAVVRRGATHRSRLAPTLFIAGGIAATATGAVLFAFDQDSGRGKNGDLMPSWYDTAPWGVAVGVVGLASVGVGTWLLFHRESSAAPIVSLQRSSGVIGWTGTF